VEEENTIHTFSRCPMMWNLWQAMEEVWLLPALEDMANTDSEWLLHFLDGKIKTVSVM
jgi:hypothetical protein